MALTRKLFDYLKKITNCFAIAAALYTAGINQVRAEETKPQEAPVTFNLSTYLLNGFYAIEGPTKINNPVNQSALSLDSLALMGYVWLNYDLYKNCTTEVDISTKFKIPSLDFLGGVFSGLAGYEVWTYPQASSNIADYALVLSFNYSHWFNTNITLKKVVTESVDNGYLAILELSKSINVSPQGMIKLNPKISSALLKDFFGGTGVSYIRSGASLTISLPSEFQLGFSGVYQKSLDDKLAENTPIFMLGVEKSF